VTNPYGRNLGFLDRNWVCDTILKVKDEFACEMDDEKQCCNDTGLYTVQTDKLDNLPVTGHISYLIIPNIHKFQKIRHMFA
jgi:hypothetical protein